MEYSVVEKSAPRPALKRQAQRQKPAEAGCGGLGAAVRIGEGCFACSAWTFTSRRRGSSTDFSQVLILSDVMLGHKGHWFPS